MNVTRNKLLINEVPCGIIFECSAKDNRLDFMAYFEERTWALISIRVLK